MQGRGRTTNATGICRRTPLFALLVGCIGPYPGRAAREHDLAEWLAGLAVRLPDHSAEVLGSTLDLLGLACSGFRVRALDAVELEPSWTARTVELSVHDALIEHCAGTWTLAPPVGPRLQGNFSWSIIELNLRLPLVLDASEEREPLYVRSSGCQTAFHVGNVSFEGSMSLPLTVLSDLLAAALEPSVHRLGCRAPPLLLAGLNGHLVEWLRTPKPPPGPTPAAVPRGVPEEELVDWRAEVPLLRGLPGPPAEARAMRRFVSKLTQGTGRLEGRLPLQFIPLADRAAHLGLAATVGVAGFGIAGLGSVSECQMLAPVPEEAHSLHLNCSVDMLNITVSVSLELTPVDENASPLIIASKGLMLHTSLSMSLKGIHMAVQALMAADRTRADKLTIGGLMHQPLKVAFATLAALFYAVNITLLDGVVDDIVDVSISQDGGRLGWELAGAFNSFASTFLSAHGFQSVLPNAFRAEVYPRARDMLNEQLLEIQEMLPSADPGGGGLHDYPTSGIDPVWNFWVFICSTCVFFPVCIAVYALLRKLKRRTARAEALQSLSPAQSLAHPTFRHHFSWRLESSSLADACSTRMRCVLPLLALSIMTGGVIAVLTPACDVRVKAFGGLLDAAKPTLDESVIVYSFFQMVRDFSDAGASLMTVMLVVGGLAAPQLGSVTALFAFAAPINPKFRGYCCLALTVILRALFVNQCFIGLSICILRARAVIPGAEIDAVAEPGLAIPVATHGSLSAMLMGSLLLYLHREHAAVNQPARAASGECPRTVAILALVGSAIGALSLCMAFAMEILSFEMTGLVGIAESLPISRLPNRRDFWALDLPMGIITSTDEGGTTLFVGILYFVAVGVAPILCFAAWVLQWGWVVATKQHPHLSQLRLVRWAALLSPLLYSWCSLDVLAVATLIGYLEMDMPLQFIAQQKAATLCQLVQSELGQPCVRVEGQLHAGFGFLLVAAAISLALFLVSYRYLGLGSPSETDKPRMPW